MSAHVISNIDWTDNFDGISLEWHFPLLVRIGTHLEPLENQALPQDIAKYNIQQHRKKKRKTGVNVNWFIRICFNNRVCFPQYIPEPSFSPLSQHSAAQNTDSQCCYASNSQISPWTAVWDEEIQTERGERESERDGVGRGRVVSLEVQQAGYLLPFYDWTTVHPLPFVRLPAWINKQCCSNMADTPTWFTLSKCSCTNCTITTNL